MIVQPAGNARVKKEQKKNVHAFIGGKIGQSPGLHNFTERISYNPYRDCEFFIVKNGESIYKADAVLFSSDGKCYI